MTAPLPNRDDHVQVVISFSKMIALVQIENAELLVVRRWWSAQKNSDPAFWLLHLPVMVVRRIIPSSSSPKRHRADYLVAQNQVCLLLSAGEQVTDVPFWLIQDMSLDGSVIPC